MKDFFKIGDIVKILPKAEDLFLRKIIGCIGVIKEMEVCSDANKGWIGVLVKRGNKQIKVNIFSDCLRKANALERIKYLTCRFLQIKNNR